MRRLSLVAALSVLALSGCIFADRAPTTDALAISEADGRLVVAICEDIEYDFVLVESRVGDEPWVELLEYEGGLVEVGAGNALLSGTAEEFDLPDLPTVDHLGTGDLVGVLIRDRRSSTRGWDTTFVIPDGGLQEGSWVLYDDSVSTEPCPG